MGCANIAERSMIPAMMQCPQIQLIAVASRDIEKAKKLASKFSCEAIEEYENLLNRTDIDCIYMPLPTGIHNPWIQKTIDSGKHILVEKSLSENYETAKLLVDHAKFKKILIMENFMFPYHPQNVLAKSIIDSGKLGNIRVVRSSFGFPPLSKDNFRYDLKLGGGALFDAAAYTTKAAQFILGIDDLNVEAANLFYENGVDIYGNAYLSNSNNQVAQLSWGFDNFYQCNYEVWGSLGKIFVERAFTAPSDFRPRIIVETQGNREEILVPPENQFVLILEEFIKTILNGEFDSKYNEVISQAKIINDIRVKSKTN